jgi:hypothetical protein
MTMLVLYTAGIFRMYVPYLNYCINYKYISTVLCENKNKPQMHCNGKCHLKKTIKTAAEEDSKSKAPTLIKVFGFQEMPAEALRLSVHKPLPVREKNQAPIAVYVSPVIDITSPPPQAA